MKTLILALAALFLIPAETSWSRTLFPSAGIHPLSKRDTRLAWLFANKVSEVQATCSGLVILKLPDDIADIRHQRFIIQLASGQTLLIAHNIDLAKRVKPLRIGDKVSVRGEYIWNEKGGLIHYTHDDPAGIDAGGWIKRKGVVFH